MEKLDLFIEAVAEEFRHRGWSYSKIADKLTEISEDGYTYTEKKVERLLKKEGFKNFAELWTRLDDLSYLSEVEFTLDNNVDLKKFYQLERLVNDIRLLFENN